MNILVIVFIILAVCKNLTQIENVSQNIVHAEIKCPHDHLAYLFSYQSYQYNNHNVCLYYWLYHSSKVRYLNKTFRPTMKNHHLLIKLLLSGQVELNPGGPVVPVVEMSIGAVKPLNVIHVKPGIILTAKVVWTPQCTI